MADNSTTNKIKIDISELKAELQNANRQLKLVNAEFKATSASMEDWTKSADGVQAKLKQLNSAQDIHLKKLDNLKAQYKIVASEQGENSKEAQALAIAIKNQEAIVNRTQLSIKKYSDELKSMDSTSEEVKTSSQKLSDTIVEQQSRLDKLKSKYKDVALTQGENSKEARELSSNIQKLSSKLSDNKNKMQSAEDAANKFDKSLEETGNEAKNTNNGFTILKGTLANLAAEGFKKALSAAKDFATQMIESAASVKAENAQYEQTFGEFEIVATQAIGRVANSADILDTRLKGTATRMYAFAKTSGMDSTQALGLMERALKVTADQAAYYDRSLEDVSESLQSFLKGNYENDAALGLSATETTRNAAANELYGKSFKDLSEAQKQLTLLKMVEDANKLSGALGQAARESDGWENVTGNLKETWKQFQAQIGDPVLDQLVPRLQKVNKEFNSWQKSVNWEDFGEQVGDLFDITNKGLQFTVKNAKPIGITLKSLITAWVTYKAVQLSATAVMKTTNAAMMVGKTVMTAFSAATKTATAAQTGLNLAQKASPWGLVLGLISGVIVALGSYISSTNKAKGKTDEHSQSTRKLLEDYQNLNDELKENKKTREENIASVDAEIGSIQIMADKLDELSKKEKKSNEEKDLMKYYVDQLNEAIPNLNLQYDREKDSLNKSTEAIKENIRAQKELAISKAYQEQLLEISKDIAKVEREKAEAIKNSQDKQKEYNEALREFNKLKQETNDRLNKGDTTVYTDDTQDRLAKLKLETEKLYGAWQDSLPVIDKYNGKIKDLGKQYSNVEKLSKDKLNLSEAIKAFDGLVETARAKGIAVPQSLIDGVRSEMYIVPSTIEEMQELINYDSMVNDAKSKGLAIPKSISDGVASGSLSVKDAIQQMKDLIQFNDLVNKSTVAGTDIPNKLQEQIDAGALKPIEAIQRLEELANFDELVNKSGIAGSSVPEYLRREIALGTINAVSAVQQLNNSVGVQLDTLPAKAGVTGANVGSSLTNGMTSKKELLSSTALSLANTAVNAVRSSRENFENSGGYLVDGIRAGINANSWMISSAVANIGNIALSAFQSALGIHSPSRVFKAEAKWIPAGIGVGISENTKLAINPLNNMLDKVKEKSKILSENLVTSETKANLINKVSGLRNTTTNRLNYVNEKVTETKNITFNQYNTSPKALSRLDIYRQTNSQLFSAKRRLYDV